MELECFLKIAISDYITSHIQESRKGHIRENAMKYIFAKPPEEQVAKMFDDAFKSSLVSEIIARTVGNGYPVFRDVPYVDKMIEIRDDIVNGTKNFKGVLTTFQPQQTQKMESLVALKIIIKDVFGENYHEVHDKKLSELNVMNAAILVDNYGYFYDTEGDYEMILRPCNCYCFERLLDDTVIICAISKHGKQTPVVEKIIEKFVEEKTEISNKRFPTFDEKDFGNEKKKVKFGKSHQQPSETVVEKVAEKVVEEETFDDDFDDFDDASGNASILAYLQSSEKATEKRLEALKEAETPKQQPKPQQKSYQGNRQWNRQQNRQRKSYKNPFDDFGGNRQRNPGKNPQKGNNNQKGFKQAAQEKQHKEQQEKKHQETIAKNAQRKVVEKPIEQKHIEQKPEKHVKWSVVNGSKEQPKKQVETVVEKKVGNDEDWDYVEKQPEEQQVEEQQVEEPTINEIIMNELLEEDETIDEEQQVEEQQVENQPTQQEQQQQEQQVEEQQDEILDEKTLQESFKQVLQESRNIFNENFGDEEMNAKACIATMSYFESLDFNELEAKFSKEDNLKGKTVYDLLKH